jgi:NADPH:quinone reductase-like Zn-dependent oxidoreductase
MADGAGLVTAVGAGVTEFAVGDAVVSTFFRNGCRAAMCPSDFQLVPGDGVDGFARESVTLPATSFTHAPRAGAMPKPPR